MNVIKEVHSLEKEASRADKKANDDKGTTRRALETASNSMWLRSMCCSAAFLGVCPIQEKDTNVKGWRKERTWCI